MPRLKQELINQAVGSFSRYAHIAITENDRLTTLVENNRKLGKTDGEIMGILIDSIASRISELRIEKR